MRLSIIGYGAVGKALHKVFPDALIYDLYLNIGSKECVRNSDIAFICVPTPSLSDGGCDVSAVESVIGWLEATVIVIVSTVPVGFTDKMVKETGKRIVFHPEYFGETAGHPFSDMGLQPWITLGGDRSDVNLVIRAYKKAVSSEVKFIRTDAKTAELAKYMTNCFLALKVTFCNEFYDIAGSFGIDYNELREVWLADPRMGRSHTFVHEDSRGFSGKCLPKDTSALVSSAEAKGVDVSLMKAALRKNQKWADESK